MSSVSAFFSAFLSAGPLTVDEERSGPGIQSWRVGPCQLFVDGAPMRISVHYEDRVLLAQRARAEGTSIEFRTSSGWHSIAKLKSARRAEGSASDERPLLLEADGEVGTSVLLTIRWSDARGALEIGWRLSGADILSVRDDFVTMRGERFDGVERGSPLRTSQDAAGAIDRESDPRGLWILSSRGYALGARASPGEVGGVRGFFPDPDTLRVEARGPALNLVLLTGEPRSTLPRIRSYRSLSASVRGGGRKGDARIDAPGPESSSSSGFWLRLPRRLDGDEREALSREFRRRDLPVPSFRFEDSSSEERRLESRDDSSGRSPPPSPVFSRISRRPPGDWGELAGSVRRILERSVTGTPDWMTISWRALAGVSVTARHRDDRAGATVGPLPFEPGPEFDARLLAVAATQPILCVDWPFGEARLGIERDALALVRHYVLLNSAFGRLADALSADDAERALPLWRPMFIEAPRDAAAWETRDQWLYGPDVMIAAVLSAGVTRRVAYFPAGTWVSILRDQPERVIRGPKMELIDIPPGGIGLFEREGARFGLSPYLPTAETRRTQRTRREEQRDEREEEE